MALVPDTVGKLVAAGLEVEVERGAGAAASVTDEHYAEAGAQLVDDAWGADVVVKVRKADGRRRSRDSGTGRS